MNIKLLSLAGMAALVLPAFSALAQVDQSAFWQPGEIFLSNGETKTLLHAKTDQRYRICVKETTHNVPLRVLEEGGSTLVSPGQCGEIEAKSLRVEPADRLPEGQILVVRYDRERTR